MGNRRSYDAVVIGSGPNGLAAAITLAQAGRSVLVREAATTVGGSTRSAELTLPGFNHDICSAVHALALASPFLRTLPLREHGLDLIQPPAAFAHPLDDGTAILLERSVDATSENLGRDATAYRKLIQPLVTNADELMSELLGPLRLPRHPFIMAQFGLRGFRSARGLAKHWFDEERTRAFFAGVSAHSMLPLENLSTAAFGLVLLATAHNVGWPIASGGSQKVAYALASYLRSLGGEIVTDEGVDSLDELPPVRAILCDVTPRQLLRIARERLPTGYRHRLERYRYGPGVYKVDWALDGPVPWKSAECARAGTVHLGGTLNEIAASERAAWRGEHSERPFVLLVQPSLFDQTRAPEGKHTLWAYCHVPNGSHFNMTERIEAQIERFAPGFKDLIIARSCMGPTEMERHNPNLVGGDINGGAQDIRQLFTRPMLRFNPYSTPVRGLYICSSSTPPGGGVHGMCGYFAALSALRDVL